MLLGLLGVVSLRSRQRLGVVLLVTSVITSYIFAIPLTANLLNAHLQSHEPLTPQAIEESRPAAIVVLAGGLYEEAPEYAGDTVHLRTLGRVRYAARLARQTGLPILASGGYAHEGGQPEGDIMGRLLEEEFGISPVWIENTSRNTWENALHSAAFLKARGIETIVLVTHAIHMPRAMEVFQRFGLRAIPAPTLFFPDEPEVADIYSWLPSAAAVRQINYAWHEIIGRVWYRLPTA